MERTKFKQRCIGITSAIGVLLVICGIVGIPVLKMVKHNAVIKETVLKKDSIVFDPWKSPPFPVYFEFYFFDVVNADEVLYEGKQIELVERGPYVYRLISNKENITFYKNGTVSYMPRLVFHFVPEKSAGSENDTFTSVNMLLLTVDSLMRFEYDILIKITKELFKVTGNLNLFQTHNVHDLIWGGEDPLLKTIKSIMDRLGIPFDDKFGFFNNFNNSFEGFYLMETGVNNYEDAFNILSWNGVRNLNYWSSKESNKIHGTSGNIFHSFVTRDSTLNFFFEELCRVMSSTYQKDVNVKGVDAYRFVHPEYEFDNPARYSANKGYCTPASNCLPRGLYNISNCRVGAPFSVSLPHFLYGDPTLFKRFDGLKPEKKHRPYVDVFPDIGAVIQTERKYQLNVFVRRSPLIDNTKVVNNVFFPIFWFNESTILSDDWAQFIQHKYVLPMTLVKITPFIIIALGGFCIFASLIVFCKALKKNKKPEQQPLLSSEQ